jgi:hypothetical protein
VIIHVTYIDNNSSSNTIKIVSVLKKRTIRATAPITEGIKK